jgi:hypothetical protein
MKLVGLVATAATAVVCSARQLDAVVTSIDAKSRAGQKLLSSARQLEDGFNEAFVARHSIIFDGCHNSTSWTENGFVNTALVRFRLCPTKYVHSGSCFTTRVGEYMVDMLTFVDAYMEYQLDADRMACENTREACGCEGENDDCLSYCYESYGQNGASAPTNREKKKHTASVKDWKLKMMITTIDV